MSKKFKTLGFESKNFQTFRNIHLIAWDAITQPFCYWFCLYLVITFFIDAGLSYVYISILVILKKHGVMMLIYGCIFSNLLAAPRKGKTI